jgi:hypothetical protein
MIAWACIKSDLLSASSIRLWRCCLQSAGGSFSRRLISLLVTIIWMHIVSYDDVQGLGIFIRWQFLNMFLGSGGPKPSIYCWTLIRSHRRDNHIPIVGLHSTCPIINLLTSFSECNINSINSVSQVFTR